MRKCSKEELEKVFTFIKSKYVQEIDLQFNKSNYNEIKSNLISIGWIKLAKSKLFHQLI